MTSRIGNFFNPLSNMPIVLKSRSIQPDIAEWDLFLDMNFKYMSESWPNQMKDKTEEAFKTEYEQTLRYRYSQGGRGLFLYYSQEQAIGFSNVYITKENKIKILNIAEFYVEPSYRKKGLASQMKDHLITWGCKQFATKLKIEVDKNLETANCFWSKFHFKLDDIGSRNVYSTDI
ncbi:MAG: GNAT family N-acetyltransferase [Candidatus Rhabdochlamydia sp.]